MVTRAERPGCLLSSKHGRSDDASNKNGNPFPGRLCSTRLRDRLCELETMGSYALPKLAYALAPSTRPDDL